MQRSIERILTTHTGSLPRPEKLVDMLYDKEHGEDYDKAVFTENVTDAVKGIVDAQTTAGIDVVNDGEAGKLSYFSYVTERLTGFGGEAPPPQHRPKDLSEFPTYAAFKAASQSSEKGRAPRKINRPVCVEPVNFCGASAVQVDIDNLKGAAKSQNTSDLFLSSASPGLIAMFLQNEHYDSHEAYVFALADAMRPEYEAIAAAGVLVQLDCPDLAAPFNSTKYEHTEDFRRDIAINIEALNHATKNIPADLLRMHVCWGNYEGPHHHDAPLKDIVDVILKARPAAVSFEGANPRHAHEYKVWDEVALPDGKVLMPGVIDSTTNYIEHPELVAERIINFAERVGRENVIPGRDCGFGTGAGMGAVHRDIVWAKLGALAEGARIASARLWN